MIEIGKVGVQDEILTTYFQCDLGKCHGGCCTFPGEYGAPVEADEVEDIENSVRAVSDYLSVRSKEVIKKEGVVTDKYGELMTVVIDKKDCVFVYYEGNIARCAIEKAYFDGKTYFRKPVSCHLFPIRVSSKYGLYLYFEKIPECAPAIDKGSKSKIPMHVMLKDALIRRFGKKWYENLLEEIEGKG
ncbi:MAG: hypothetical protein HW421_2500 [Ignavibacteria bacterium]|nr:hypothetical protein [Ignavibacteria bacterium]